MTLTSCPPSAGIRMVRRAARKNFWPTCGTARGAKLRPGRGLGRPGLAYTGLASLGTPLDAVTGFPSPLKIFVLGSTENQQKKFCTYSAVPYQRKKSYRILPKKIFSIPYRTEEKFSYRTIQKKIFSYRTEGKIFIPCNSAEPSGHPWLRHWS